MRPDLLTRALGQPDPAKKTQSTSGFPFLIAITIAIENVIRISHDLIFKNQSSCDFFISNDFRLKKFNRTLIENL
ncbi:MAG: hypothetical protein GYA23_13285 [Methanomicrobiales archaeon]|nr:hypothetical protein [Methanomicrobiales archaeon]